MKFYCAHIGACFLLVFSAFLHAQDQKPLKKIYIYPGYHNKLFDENFDAFGMRKTFRKLGYEPYEVRSLANLDNPDLIICFDVPAQQITSLIRYPFNRLVLFIFEPPSVVKQNFEKQYHTLFNEVYTWNDDWVNNSTHFKFYQPAEIEPMIDDIVDFDQKKLCLLVTANKSSNYKDELYSGRLKAAAFFDKFHPDEFDFYGVSWGREGYRYKTFRGPIQEGQMYEDVFTQCTCPESMRTTVKRGKGELQDCINAGCTPKVEYMAVPTNIGSMTDYMKKYKFCICYENNKGLAGYITQRIFNCFKAGCVPVYWGASNIEKHIPKGCYILKTDFPTYEALYDFLKNMSKETYDTYISNIRAYLASDAIKAYSDESFDKVLEEMIKRHEARNSV